MGVYKRRREKMGSDDEFLFSVFRIIDGKPVTLEESEFLTHCTLKRLWAREDTTSGLRQPEKEIVGFGLRRELFSRFGCFIMEGEPLDKTKDVRRIMTSRIVDVVDLDSNTAEFTTENGSRYRVLYLRRAD
jgi:hypothetical protein